MYDIEFDVNVSCTIPNFFGRVNFRFLDAIHSVGNPLLRALLLRLIVGTPKADVHRTDHTLAAMWL